MLVESNIDFASNRNLVIASVILVVGIGNLLINLKGLGVNLQIEGMALKTFRYYLKFNFAKRKQDSKTNLTRIIYQEALYE